jgi:glycerol-3-phosphate dehydrogenase
VIALMSTDRSWADPVAQGTPVVGAEVVHAARGEMACRLLDVVARRTALGALGAPSDAAVQRCADIMRGEIGWTEAQAGEEVRQVRAFYALPSLRASA